MFKIGREKNDNNRKKLETLQSSARERPRICVTVAKVSQVRPKTKGCSRCLISTIVPNERRMNVPRHWRTETGKPKSSWSRRLLDLFAKVNSTHSIFPVRSFQAL